MVLIKSSDICLSAARVLTLMAIDAATLAEATKPGWLPSDLSRATPRARRVYGYFDLLAIGAWMNLRKFGLSKTVIAELMADICRRAGQIIGDPPLPALAAAFAGIVIVVDGASALRELRPGEDVAAAADGAPAAMVIRLDMMARQIAQKIEASLSGASLPPARLAFQDSAEGVPRVHPSGAP